MPIQKVPGGYRYGKSGKIYKDRKDAERQAAAIYASGYKEKTSSMKKEVPAKAIPINMEDYKRVISSGALDMLKKLKYYS